MSQKRAFERPTQSRDLASFLSQVRRRLLADRFLRNVAVDLIIASSLLVVFLFLDRTFFPGVASLWAFSGLILAAVLVSILRTLLLNRATALETAEVADERLRLKERVSSALYLRRVCGGPQDAGSDAQRRPEWLQLVEDDATRSIATVPIRERFPVRVPRVFAWALLPLVMSGALSLWLPSFDFLGIGGRKEAAAREMNTISEEEKKLAKLLAAIAKKAEEQKLPEAKNLMELLAQQTRQAKTNEPQANQAQKAPGDPRKRALVQMTRREDAIRKGLNGQKYKRLKDALDDMKGLDLKKPDVTKKLQEALKNGDLKKAQKELDKLQDDLDKLAGKDPSELPPEERERMRKLAEELKRLARDSKAFSSFSKALSGASSQLGGGGLSAAQAGLSGLQMDLQSLALLGDEMEMLDQALKYVKAAKAQLGKPHKCPNCGKKLGNKPGGT
jgi:hypothetical protein